MTNPLKVGLSLFFQNPGREQPDAAVWNEELRLAQLAEPLGFDSVCTDQAALDFADLQVWGTPDECLEKILSIREIVGCDHITLGFRFAGLPIDLAERSLRLFAETVLPRLREGGTERSGVRASG